MRRWPALMLSLWIAVVLAIAPIGAARAAICDVSVSAMAQMRHAAGADASPSISVHHHGDVDTARDHRDPCATDHACCVSACVGQAVLPEVGATEAFVLHRIAVAGVDILPEGLTAKPPLGPPRVSIG